MIKHKVGEIKVPRVHFEDMWKIVKEAIEKLPKKLREDKKVYLFVGENEEGTKVTLTLYDKGYCLEGFCTTRYGFASDDDPARKAGEQCAACGIKKMQMYAL